MPAKSGQAITVIFYFTAFRKSISVLSFMQINLNKKFIRLLLNELRELAPIRQLAEWDTPKFIT
jgi:hypothetical protein